MSYDSKARLHREELRETAPDLFEFIAKTDKVGENGVKCGFTFQYKGNVYEVEPDFIGDGFTQGEHLAEFTEDNIRWDRVSLGVSKEEKLSFTKMLEENFNNILK